jgi:UrcA family protein
MTRPNSALVLRRASERLSAGAAALVLTFLLLLTVDVRATETRVDAPSVTVHYSDAAFGDTQGTAGVYRKLKDAARKVCGMHVGVSMALDRHLAAQACFDKALADVVRRIDRPLLTQVHTAAARRLG